MANQERTVIGYPLYQEQATLLAACRPTTTSTATTTNHTAIHTTQNQQNTNSCINRVIILSVCVLFFGGLVGLLAAPFQPEVYTPKFQVDSVTVYHLNISSSHITANWHFSFTVTNPNYHHPFYYDDIWASVFYKETNISSTTVGSFSQDNMNKTSVQATIAAYSVVVKNSVASAIVEDWSQGAVNFTVTVNAVAKIDPATTIEQQKQMTVSCEDVKVDFSLNTTFGAMLSESSECNVSLYKL